MAVVSLGDKFEHKILTKTFEVSSIVLVDGIPHVTATEVDTGEVITASGKGIDDMAESGKLWTFVPASSQDSGGHEAEAVAVEK